MDKLKVTKVRCRRAMRKLCSRTAANDRLLLLLSASVTQVPDVRLQRRWRHDTVVLHLTQHHFIFQFDRSKDSKGKGKEPDRGVLEDDDENDELWVSSAGHPHIT